MGPSSEFLLTGRASQLAFFVHSQGIGAAVESGGLCPSYRAGFIFCCELNEGRACACSGGSGSPSFLVTGLCVVC